MSENKYTRDQIKDAIWQELKESDYAGKNNDRAYEVIGIVMAGIDKIVVGDEQPGAVWLKDQYDKLYDQVKGGKRTVCYVDYHWGSKGEHEPMRDICTVTSDIFEFNARGTGYGYPRSRFDKTRDEKESFIDLCESMNVEWLCEGTAAAGREEDAVEFAEWLYKNRWFSFENNKWYYTFEQGTSMSDKQYQKEYVKTTAHLYDIFKQNRNNANS